MTVNLSRVMLMSVLMFMCMIMPVRVFVGVLVPVCMLMCMLMSVLMSVLIFMVMRMIMNILLQTIRYYADPGACDSVTLVTRDIQSPSLQVQLLQAALQDITADTQVKHRTQVHVSADPGKTVVIKYFHLHYSPF
jgi:hypothetical protein